MLCMRVRMVVFDSVTVPFRLADAFKVQGSKDVQIIYSDESVRETLISMGVRDDFIQMYFDGRKGE